MESRADRPHRAPDDVADFLITAILNVGQKNDLALLGTKILEGLGQRLTEIPFDVIFNGLNRKTPS